MLVTVTQHSSTMPAVKKEQEMEKLLALDDKTFPVIGAPKEKVPFNETIGQRIPGKLSRKRSSNSLDRKKKCQWNSG